MSTKEATLREAGCFNPNHENISADVFASSPFFDRKDIVQVKYEMIRAASNGEGSITEIADNFGFSRKSYYQARAAFSDGGLCALVPKKTGPKEAHKLNPEVRGFVNAFLAIKKDAKAREISAAIEAEMGVKIHPRTVHRYLKKN